MKFGQESGFERIERIVHIKSRQVGVGYHMDFSMILILIIQRRGGEFIICSIVSWCGFHFNIP